MGKNFVKQNNEYKTSPLLKSFCVNYVGNNKKFNAEIEQTHKSNINLHPLMCLILQTANFKHPYKFDFSCGNVILRVLK